MNNSSSYKAKKVVVQQVGKEYRESKRRMDVLEAQHLVSVGNNKWKYDHDCAYIKRIERSLQDCDERTRFIIRNEYLRSLGAGWYLPYYSPSSYYRNKKIAVYQFEATLKD